MNQRICTSCGHPQEAHAPRCGWAYNGDLREVCDCASRDERITTDLPTPDELVEARRIIRRLHFAVGLGKVRDMAGMEMWDSLVEGGRAIAVTTAYLGAVVDESYSAAWERMMAGDDND